MAKQSHKCKNKNLVDPKEVELIHEAQAGSARHKCVYCAYAAGYQDAKTGRKRKGGSETCEKSESVPVAMLDALPTSQAGNGRHKCAACAYRLGIQAYAEEQATLEQDKSTYSNDRDDSPASLKNHKEVKRFAQHRRLERDSSISRKIKKHLSKSCECCGLSMKQLYGELGEDYIEAHHRVPLKDLKEGESRVVSLKDFAALCPNCHRMVHRLEDVSDIETLRNIVAATGARHTK